MDKEITDGLDESLRQYFADHEITVPPLTAREEEPGPVRMERKTPRKI